MDPYAGGVMLTRFKVDLSIWMLSFFCFLSGSNGFAQQSAERGVQVSSSEISDLGVPDQGELRNEAQDFLGRWSLNYFGILFGPSVKNPSSYQPDPERTLKDQGRPLLLKNLVGLSYDVSEEISVTPTISWLWQPVLKHETSLEDPFLKVAHHSLVSFRNFNLYADARVHLPVSRISKENQQVMGLQTVQVLTYEIESSRFTLGLYGSGRYNVIQSEMGQGNDLELYLAPNISYQLLPHVALTLLYELRNNHVYGEKMFLLQNDEMDIEPGVSWDVTPGLMINPYLHIPTKGLGLAATSVGMMINWTLF